MLKCWLPFLLLSLMLATSCGNKVESSKYGQMKVAELLELKGPPIDQSPIPLEGGSIWLYPENEKYQIEGDTVTHGFISPQGDEKILIYWQHKFKDCKSRQTVLPHKAGEHQPPSQELACDEQGLSVVYHQDSEFISRIIEYAKQ